MWARARAGSKRCAKSAWCANAPELEKRWDTQKDHAVNIEKFIQELKSKDIDLSVVDGKLEVTGRKSALDAMTVERLKENKQAVLEFLESSTASRTNASGIPSGCEHIEELARPRVARVRKNPFLKDIPYETFRKQCTASP
jgi:hypothetical protein